MPQQVSDLNIQNDIFQLLDKVIKTGVPVEIERKGKRLLISPAEKRRDLDSLEEHPEYIVGNPDDLVHMNTNLKF
jgi:virulence-associated protein VagC